MDQMNSLRLDQLKKQMRVRYVPRMADENINDPSCEDGTVSSWNDEFVFVKFDKQLNLLGWDGTTSQGCSRFNLTPL